MTAAITDVTSSFDINYSVLTTRIKAIDNWSAQDLSTFMGYLSSEDDKQVYQTTINTYGKLDENVVMTSLDSKNQLDNFIMENFALPGTVDYSWNKFSYVPREWFNVQKYVSLIFVLQSHQASFVSYDSDQKKQTTLLEENHVYLCDCYQNHTYMNNSILSRLILSIKYFDVTADQLLSDVTNKNVLPIHTKNINKDSWPSA